MTENPQENEPENPEKSLKTSDFPVYGTQSFPNKAFEVHCRLSNALGALSLVHGEVNRIGKHKDVSDVLEALIEAQRLLMIMPEYCDYKPTDV